MRPNLAVNAHSTATRFGLRLRRQLILIALLILPLPSLSAGDRIVAIVDDQVILESELEKKIDGIRAGLEANNTPLPPPKVLARQVLERLIEEKIQIGMAERGGLKVDDETLRQAVIQIADRNHMTPEELRASLRREGVDYADFLEQIRGEIATQRLRGSQVNSQVKVTDREIQNWMESHGKAASNPNAEYLIGHILIATPQAATPEAILKAKEKADRLTEDLKKGLDFKQASVTSSDSPQALTGGELGWRKLSEIPSLFAEFVPTMQKGDIQGSIRSSSGFHIIKLIDTKNGTPQHVLKTHVRHILIKPNELINNEEARKKLESIKARIQAGDDFGDLARGNSDDKGSAVKGGDLGFVSPGALVPEFESAMNSLQVNQLSEPVQSQFGWHLIQVLERKESDDADEILKKQAQDEIFKRKVEEETELWLKRIRDEAYVEYRDPDLAPEGKAPTKEK